MNIFSFAGPVVFVGPVQFCLCGAKVLIRVDSVSANGRSCVPAQLYLPKWAAAEFGELLFQTVFRGDSLLEGFLEVLVTVPTLA